MLVKIKNIFSFHFEGIKSVLYIKKYDSKLIGLFLLHSLIDAIIPFVELFMIAAFVDKLIISEYNHALKYILVYISIGFIAGSICDYLYGVITYRAKLLQVNISKEISLKSLILDYDVLEDPETLKKLSNAEYAIEHTGGYYRFLMYYNEYISKILKIIGASGVIVSFFMLPSTSRGNISQMISNPWILMAIFILATALSLYFTRMIAQKSKGHSQDLFDMKIRVERQFDYFTDRIFMNFNIGKEIRLFKLRNLISYKYKEHLKTAKVFFEEFYHEKAKNKVSKIMIVNALYLLYVYIIVLFKVEAGSLSAGELMKYVGVLSLFNVSTNRIVELNQLIKLQLGYVKVFTDFLSIESKYNGSNAVVDLDNQEHMIEFHNVSFKYDQSETYALKNVSIKVGLSKSIAIVGRNGSGKSTFVKLMTRLYQPTDGYITYNGVKINTLHEDELRKLFSVVFQDYQLFDFSISENIACMDQWYDEEIISSINRVKMSSFIEGLDKGFETSLSNFDEDGIKLSGGESQKIAIARAIYKNSPFMVLDEPTAALDPASEYEIFSSLKDIISDRVGIFISHRMTSCIFCDEIIVFEEGKIIQNGTHKTLMNDTSNAYYELYNVQKKHYERKESFLA